VRLRGCLLNASVSATHQQILGQVHLANVSVMSREADVQDPFAVPRKTVGDLLRFDLAAADFRRICITGQLLGAEGLNYFLSDGTNGLRFKLREPAGLQPGDLITVTGFPELGGASPVLREALVRKIGSAVLTAPREIKSADLQAPGLDATRVRLTAVLNGVREEPTGRTLYLHAGGDNFTARLPASEDEGASWEPGSRLELTGVYVADEGDDSSGRSAGEFTVLVNSPTDIRVLGRPPWWTLRRLLVLTGSLVLVLLLAIIWIQQLSRRVEERTAQLQHEIRERERAQQQRMVAEEKSRIARDLHDDLGSSLTEIGMQASLARRTPLDSGQASEQFTIIADKTRAMVAALDIIVWAVDPEEDTLQTTVEYLAGYADEFLAASGLERRFKIPIQLPDVTLGGRVRHELLMVVKEALNNIVRHARATTVAFAITAEPGFDATAIGAGHGVANLGARLAALGGESRIQSGPGTGTRLQFILPLTQ